MKVFGTFILMTYVGIKLNDYFNNGIVKEDFKNYLDINYSGL